MHNPELKEWVETYAQDQELFFTNYAKAHVKVSEAGHEDDLLTEYDESHIVDGGYVENPKNHWAEKYF